MAGRITLAQSVLLSLPIFQMQSAKLPRGVCDMIDKLVTGFIRGSTVDQRKPHLVKWEVLCSKKKNGGLGLRPTAMVNDAMLMKLGWQFLSDPDALWARVLSSKYGWTDFDSGFGTRHRGTQSSTWPVILVLPPAGHFMECL
ncbi:hypothetical protein Scep_012416 [Stephania cephalantha]|uniref:Uncharacterized protein n=1 Tax=Stephania cephalantha TaxID=152367 RepID=A0AAP0JGU7_9MAGN